MQPAPVDTRERILDGASRALARHGLAKLDMRDVSESAGVSRPTLYRYFANRQALLHALSVREGQRFWRRCIDALEDAPAGEERIRVLVGQATRQAREHPGLQRLLETDPAFVLRSVREVFPLIRAQLQGLVGPPLEATRPVREGAVAVEDLVDGLTRLLVAAFLIPDPDSERLVRALSGLYRSQRDPGDGR